MKPHILVCFFTVFSMACWGQDDDVFAQDTVQKDIISSSPTETSPVKEKKHSPALAGGLSAALPGAGQFYNKKYWKIPIDYAGFAAAGYFVYSSSTQYIKYRDEYRNRLNGKTELFNPDFKNYNTDNINSLKLQQQRNMQISIIVLAAWYFINILDAVVDAHLTSFDVSDNLSMQFAPDIGNFAWENSYKPQSIGLSFTLNLK